MTLLQAIKEFDFYSGQHTEEIVTVSEIAGADALQMALRRMNEIPKDYTITQATLGSIFDLGLKSLIERLNIQFNKSFRVGTRVDYKLPNGITLSGEPDILHDEPKEIYDAKLTKIYAMEMCSNNTMHQYRIQLGLYDLLLGGGHDLYILWGLKDQSEIPQKGKSSQYHEAIIEEFVPRIDYNTLIQLAVMKSSLMVDIVNGAKLPDKCEDTWRNDVRCKYYCECKSFCPYYNRTGKDEPF